MSITRAGFGIAEVRREFVEQIKVSCRALPIQTPIRHAVDIDRRPLLILQRFGVQLADLRRFVEIGQTEFELAGLDRVHAAIAERGIEQVVHTQRFV